MALVREKSRVEYAIDIRTIFGCKSKKYLNSNLMWFLSFASTDDFYFFGCHRGLIVTNHNFEQIRDFDQRLTRLDDMRKIVKVSDQLLIILFVECYLALVDAKSLILITKQKFEDLWGTLDLQKTWFKNEFILCTEDVGLLFVKLCLNSS